MKRRLLVIPALVVLSLAGPSVAADEPPPRVRLRLEVAIDDEQLKTQVVAVMTEKLASFPAVELTNEATSIHLILNGLPVKNEKHEVVAWAMLFLYQKDLSVADVRDAPVGSSPGCSEDLSRRAAWVDWYWGGPPLIEKGLQFEVLAPSEILGWCRQVAWDFHSEIVGREANRLAEVEHRRRAEAALTKQRPASPGSAAPRK